MHTYKMYMYICPGQLIFSKNGSLEMFVLCFVGLHQLSGVTEDPRSLTVYDLTTVSVVSLSQTLKNKDTSLFIV